MNLERLEKFIMSLRGDVYPEPLANEGFIESGIESMKDYMKTGDKVLDVGCGHGHAMNKFKELDLNPVGITLDTEDKAKAIDNDVHIMDMSDLRFNDEEFDGIWARHSLEHSIIPYYTLWELSRVLKTCGWIYIELPAPDTGCHHECNGNHYSIMPISMWGNLLHRLGFKDLKFDNITFKLKEPYKGDELYFRIRGIKG